MSGHETSIEELVSELVDHLQADANYDPQRLLEAHPQHAAELQRRLALLRASGLLQPLAGAKSPRAEDPRESLRVRLDRRREHSERYAVTGEIGRGGMGRVVEAWEEDLQRPVAMKTLHAGQRELAPSAAVLGRFLHEARITAQLDHPGIVPVHELGIDDRGHLYYTMRLVRGSTFESLIAKVHAGLDGWNLRRALEVLLRACEALAYAHDRKVIHRDLKPSNLMVGSFGEVYVMEWGLAKALDAPTDAPVAPRASGPAPVRREGKATPLTLLATGAGRALGTPAYMSPEQARGELESIGPATDVYSLGAILYHLLSSRVPYSRPGSDSTPSDPVALVVAGPPPPLRQLAPRSPPELVAICEKAMSRSIAGRYASVSALMEDLRAYLEYRPGLAWRDRPVRAVVKLARRRPVVTLAVAAGTVLALLGLSLFLEQSRRHAITELGLADREARTIPAEVQRLRQVAYRFSSGSQGTDYAAWAQSSVKALADLDLDLSPASSAREFSQRFEDIRRRNASTAQELLFGLYDLQMRLLQSGAHVAWNRTRGVEIVPAPHLGPLWQERVQLSAARLQREHPSLSTLWPKLQETLQAIETDPWRRDIHARQLDWWTTTEDHLTEIDPGKLPRTAADLEWLGRVMLNTRHLARGQEAFAGALAQDGERFEAHFQLGRLLSTMGGVENRLAAWEHIQQAVRLGPGSPWAWTILGVVSADLADTLTRTQPDEFRSVLGNRPHLLSSILLGPLATEMGERSSWDPAVVKEILLGTIGERARNAYWRAIELDPSYAHPLSSLANYLPDDASKEFLYDRALGIDPNLEVALRSKAAWIGNREPKGLVEPWYDEEVLCRRKLAELFPRRQDYTQDLAFALHARGTVKTRSGAVEAGRLDCLESCSILRALLAPPAQDRLLLGRLAAIEWDAGEHELALAHVEHVLEQRCSDLGERSSGETLEQALKNSRELLWYVGARAPTAASIPATVRSRWCEALARARQLIGELEARVAASTR